MRRQRDDQNCCMGEKGNIIKNRANDVDLRPKKMLCIINTDSIEISVAHYNYIRAKIHFC